MEALPGQHIGLEIEVRADLCYEQPYREVTGIFRGHWTHGFETSSFRVCVDCELGVLPEPGTENAEWASIRVWADLTDQAWDQISRWTPDGWVWDAKKVLYVNWHGTLKGPKYYGDYEFLADRVLMVRPGNNGRDCRYPTGEPRTEWPGYSQFPVEPDY